MQDHEEHNLLLRRVANIELAVSYSGRESLQRKSKSWRVRGNEAIREELSNGAESENRDRGSGSFGLYDLEEGEEQNESVEFVNVCVALVTIVQSKQVK
jgi:hypothetical protein